MKKSKIISITVILVFIVSFLCLYFVMTAPKFAGDFSISEFQKEIDSVSIRLGKNYGNIDDYKSAAKAGKNSISDYFENSNGSIFEWMSCDVKYDKENDAYYVYTYHTNPCITGGSFDVIIQSDGTVLAIWGEE